MNSSTYIKLPHRFWHFVMEGLEQGIRQFFIYGNNLWTELFYNEGWGNRSFLDSLVLQLFYPAQQHPTDKVILWDNGRVTLYQRNTKNQYKISHIALDKILLECFSINEPAILEQPPGLEEQTIKQNDNSESQQIAQRMDANNQQRADYLTLEKLVEGVRRHHTAEEVAIVIRNLAWAAYLFANTTPKVDFVKEIRVLGENVNEQQRHLVFIVLDSLETVQRYFPELSERLHPAKIFVGGPSQREIYLAFTRQQDYGQLTEQHFETMAGYAKSARSSLRSALNLFVHIQLKMGDQFYNPNKVLQEFHRTFGVEFSYVSWEEDVILESNVKKEIEYYIKKFMTSGNTGIAGLILYGPPGNGKTTIAKGLAQTAGLSFLSFKVADILQGYVGHSSQEIRKIIAEARACAPTLIFIDEVDSLFPKRGGQESSTLNNEIITQFSAEMQGVQEVRHPVFYVFATNRLDLIDSAILSRMKRIHIDLPDDECRKKMILRRLNPQKKPFYEFEISNDAILKPLVELTKGFSGRELENEVISLLVEIVQSNSESKQPKLPLTAAIGYIIDRFYQTTIRELRLLPYIFRIEHYQQLPNSEVNSWLGNSYLDVKKEIQEFCSVVSNADRFRDYGQHTYKILALLDEGKHAKQQLISCLAQELKMNWIALNTSIIPNDGWQYLQNLLKKTLLRRGLIIFTEISNSSSLSATVDFTRFVYQQANLIWVIGLNAESSHERIIDADQYIYLRLPYPEEISELVRSYLQSHGFIISEFESQAATKALPPKPSIKEITHLCKKAIRRAILQDTTVIHQDFFYDNIAQHNTIARKN